MNKWRRKENNFRERSVLCVGVMGLGSVLRFASRGFNRKFMEIPAGAVALNVMQADLNCVLTLPLSLSRCGS